MWLHLLFQTFTFLILFTFAWGSDDFRCNDLSAQAGDTSLRTFEYINPKTKLRGVACVSLLNHAETLLMYLEEETAAGGEGHRKQAVGRAQLHSPAPPGTRLYTGVLHVTRNIADSHEDLFDLDNSPFTFSVALETGLVSFSVKSRKSAADIVYMWQPRLSVPRWSMHVDIPGSCGIKSYSINDPVPRTPKDRDGIVCVLQETPQLLRFFSLGWKKSGEAGKPRKFVNFGSLRKASPNFTNIFTGRIHTIEFPCGCERKTFKESALITAVRSVNTNSLMIYGDLQEEWHDIQTRIDPLHLPRYPLLPIDTLTDYSADLHQIYGLSSVNFK